MLLRKCALSSPALSIAGGEANGRIPTRGSLLMKLPAAHEPPGNIGGLQPGTSVSVVVDRGGQQVTLDVTLAARPLPSQLP